MAFHTPPLDRHGFEIALICALPLEASCVQAVFDEFWKDYGKAPGDPNAYTAGIIGKHNVVLAHMPGMGTTSAAAVAVGLRSSFPKIKLALVVGICGGVPYGTDCGEIVLGDVIISQGLIPYDFGSQYPEAFKRKDTIGDSLGRPSPEIRAIEAKLETYHYKQKMQSNIATFLKEIQLRLPSTKHPGQENDILYHPSYAHRHHTSAACDECGKGDRICKVALKMECENLGCETVMRVSRKRLIDTPTVEPLIHFGIMGSSNTVMKSGGHRDQIAQTTGIIAFEMEGAGVWEYFPSMVIKGVCDYADSHKRKGWQRYAAAAAAACMKAFLVEWSLEDAPANPVDAANAKTYFLIPRRRVKNFFGRREELDKIGSFYNDGVERPRILVLHALGGQGKSQIALEYCQRSRTTYRGVFWIDCSSTSTTSQSFVAVAQELDGSMVELLEDVDVRVKFAIRTLEQWKDRWLMVFDNYDDPTSFPHIEQFIPQGGNGDILFTSRHRGLGELGTILDIPPMQEDTGVALLLHRYPGIEVYDFMSEGSKIVNRLGGLALAIDQASAYMEYKQLPIDQLSDFLPQYEVQRQKVLQHTADHFWKYTKISDQNERETAMNAFTTWEMTFNRLLDSQDSGDAVAHFLTLTAFLGQVYISESLFKHHWKSSTSPPNWLNIFITASEVDKESSSSDADQDVNGLGHLPSELSQAADHADTESLEKTWDAERFWYIIRLAYRISLLQSISPATETEGASFLLHPLIRDWLQLRQRPRKRQIYTQEAIDLIVSSIQTYENRDSDARIKQSILLHMDAILSHVEEFFEDGHRLGQDIQSCVNASWFVLFYCNQGRFDVSSRLIRTAIETQGKELDKEHPDTLSSMNNLAKILGDQGKYPEAEQMHREVVEARERVLGKEHPSTLISMNNLATAMRDQGNHPGAEQIHREVVEAKKRVLGKEHLSTLTSMNNLANVLRDQGKYPWAEQILREVVDAWERVLGKEHPDTLTSISNLASVLGDQGKYSEAEQIHRGMMEVRERVLGKEHPDTLMSANNLAGMLGKKGKYSEAEQMNREIVEARERVLGKEHRDTLSSMNNLASVLRDQGKYPEAEQMIREVVEARERVLGKEHPLILMSMNNLASVLWDQGKYPEAESLQVQVYKASLEILGSQHPHVAVYFGVLLSIWESQGHDDAVVERMLRDI